MRLADLTGAESIFGYLSVGKRENKIVSPMKDDGLMKSSIADRK
jgi:hypothetical protein